LVVKKGSLRAKKTSTDTYRYAALAEYNSDELYYRTYKGVTNRKLNRNPDAGYIEQSFFQLLKNKRDNHS
jgi:hypothetical protein